MHFIFMWVGNPTAERFGSKISHQYSSKYEPFDINTRNKIKTNLQVLRSTTHQSQDSQVQKKKLS